jgi:YjbE family integral membrane protein
MELFSPAWFSALAAIVLIDLVLAGDNAIVIALAARDLPPALRRKAVVWGSVGAIAVRSLLTLVAVWLLQLPGLMGLGGAALVWIAYRLLVPAGDGKAHGASTSFWSAMRTIVVADALMGVDNVLGVAGAAHGSFLLVLIGLALSVPIVVWGSSVVLRLLDRFSWLTYAGAAVLAATAAKMIVAEPLLDALFDPHRALQLAFAAIVVAGVLGAGWAVRRRANVTG